MAVLKNSEVKKMSDKELNDKLTDLKAELTRGSVTANKANAKTKELKRAISRILTAMNAKKSQIRLNSSEKKELKK
ncbi:MAG: 50S ribosomal protein L29 [Nanoarchaeota archaeon]|nr:50S ribosomal protein L29 [Nanoarchaeota archaeon]MBU0977783.1 50S ribosomal protein L29 [Nanoarchaeota archaeon]